MTDARKIVPEGLLLEISIPKLIDGDGSLPSNEARSVGLPFGLPAPASPSIFQTDSQMNSPKNGGNGYIKLFRSALDIPKSDDPGTFSLWIRLLLLATHASLPNKTFKGKTIILLPGQLLTSHVSLAVTSGLSESKVRRILKRFKTDEQIDEQTDNRSSLITIRNWSKWQSSDEQDDEQPTSNRRATDEQVTTHKNGENEENEKNLSPPYIPPKGELDPSQTSKPERYSPFDSYSDVIQRGVRWFVRKVLEVYPQAKLVDERALSIQAYHLQKIYDHYDESLKEFAEAIEFAEWSHIEHEYNDHCFDWLLVTRSIGSLRKVKKDDTISRMEIILEQSKNWNWEPISP